MERQFKVSKPVEWKYADLDSLTQVQPKPVALYVGQLEALKQMLEQRIEDLGLDLVKMYNKYDALNEVQQSLITREQWNANSLEMHGYDMNDAESILYQVTLSLAQWEQASIETSEYGGVR
jgi:hypothetical protein